MRRHLQNISILAAILCIALLPACTPANGGLTTRMEECAPMPEKRASATCFVVGENAYIAFGRDTTGRFLSTMLRYQPEQDKWSETTATPIKARVNACACTRGDAVYIGLGYDGSGYQRADSSYLNDWWCYRPETGEWKALAPYPNHRTDRAVCFATEDAIYVGYGFQTNYTRDMFRYDIEADRWDSIDVHVSPMGYPTRSFGGAGASNQGRHFYGGGYRGESLKWWAEFMPEGQWIERSTIPGRGITLAAASAIGPYILLIGGQHVGGVGTDGCVEATVRCYNTQTDSWSVIGTLPEGRLNHSAFSYGEWVYVAGGDNERFSPTQRMWRIQVCNE